MDIGKVGAGILVFFVGIIEVLLGFRFIFLLLAANSNAQFSAWVFNSTDPLVLPFQGVFPTFGVADFTLDLATLLAMIVYGLGAFIALQLAKYFEGMVLKPKAPAPFANQHHPSPQQPAPMQPMQTPQATPAAPPQQAPQSFNQQLEGQPQIPQNPVGDNVQMQPGQDQANPNNPQNNNF